MEGESGAHGKRGGNLFSRRQAAHNLPVEETRPKIPSPSLSKPKISTSLLGANTGNLQALLITTPAPSHNKDDEKRKQYRVTMPTRMLWMLGLIFFIMPLLVFLYKEMHIHENQDQAHFRSEKFANVNTEEVFSKFADRSSSQSTNALRANTTVPAMKAVNLTSSSLIEEDAHKSKSHKGERPLTAADQAEESMPAQSASATVANATKPAEKVALGAPETEANPAEVESMDKSKSSDNNDEAEVASPASG